MPQPKRTGKPQAEAEDMPGVRQPDKVIAICCSDLHLSAKPPVARSNERNWFKAMARSLVELQNISTLHDARIIYAGDIFDKWNVPPELITFAMETLPQGYSIPGQHDLPEHNYNNLRKSAYWTMVKAGVLLHFDAPVYFRDVDLSIHPFAWGAELLPLDEDDRIKEAVHLAVCHAYCYQSDDHHPGASKSASVMRMKKALRGYTCAIFGDNHKGFHMVGKRPHIFNCGGFMARKSDERTYKPTVGLLKANGEFESHYLDTTDDTWLEADPKKMQQAEMLSGGFEQFIQGMRELSGGQAIDFETVCSVTLNTLSVSARRAVLSILEEARNE